MKEKLEALKPAACAAGVCGVEFADEVPRLGVERGIGARRARERRLIDEDDFAERHVALDGLDGGGVLGQLQALGEQALVDDVVEQRGFAGAGDAAEADEAAQRAAETRGRGDCASWRG